MSVLSYGHLRGPDTLSPPTWLQNVNAPNGSAEMGAIAETANSLVDHLQAKGASAINFGLVSRKNPNTRHLVVLLRTTFPVRKEVQGWRELRDFTQRHLEDCGFQGSRLMRGLLVD